MSDKIYVGSGKSSNYGVNISVCLTDLPKEHIFEYNGKKYIKLTVNEKREVDQYGKTHSVSVNTWKPDNQQTEPDVQADDDTQLPF